MKKAKLIVIEGTDGSGKETQSKKLFEYYKNIGKKIEYFSFPIYESPTGKIVGGPYLGKEDICPSFFEETAPNVDPIVSSLYYAADRRYNFLKTINKALFENEIVILDRYTTSNMGHQASKAKNEEEFEYIVNFIEKLEYDLCQLPRPDIVIFLYMPYKASIDLRKKRKFTDDNEKNIGHIINAEKSYIKLAKQQNWEYINCIRESEYNNLNDIKTVEDIHAEIIERVK